MQADILMALQICEEKYDFLMENTLDSMVVYWHALCKEGYIDSIQSAIVGDFHGFLMDEYNNQFSPVVLKKNEKYIEAFVEWFNNKIPDIKNI
jgi:hypothetical protein